MNHDEYRPRIRASRRHPVTRNANIVIVACRDVDDAKAIEMLLRDIFKAATKVENLGDQVAAMVPPVMNPLIAEAEIVDHDNVGVDTAQSGT